MGHVHEGISQIVSGKADADFCWQTTSTSKEGCKYVVNLSSLFLFVCLVLNDASTLVGHKRQTLLTKHDEDGKS